MLDSGALGEVFYWKLEHNQNVVMAEEAGARSRDGIGGGAIMSCLTHQIDALRWYGGEVARVTCLTKVLPERMEGESAGVIAAEMASGALANLSINWFTRSHVGPNALWYELVQVCGTRGEAYYLSGKGTFVLLHDETNTAAVERYGREALNGFVPSGLERPRTLHRRVGETLRGGTLLYQRPRVRGTSKWPRPPTAPRSADERSPCRLRSRAAHLRQPLVRRVFARPSTYVVAAG